MTRWGTESLIWQRKATLTHFPLYSYTQIMSHADHSAHTLLSFLSSCCMNFLFLLKTLRLCRHLSSAPGISHSWGGKVNLKTANTGAHVTYKHNAKTNKAQLIPLQPFIHSHHHHHPFIQLSFCSSLNHITVIIRPRKRMNALGNNHLTCHLDWMRVLTCNICSEYGGQRSERLLFCNCLHFNQVFLCLKQAFF